MLEQYLLSLQEGTIISDKTVSVNLEQFKSGEKNKLLILGVSGSGKTTIGEQLAKKYKCKWISIDSMWWRLKQKYFKNVDETKEQMQEKLFEFIIKSLKSNERAILEGVDFMIIYSDFPKYRKLILNQPMIILGLSALRAGIRAGIRNQKREPEGGYMKSIYWMSKSNIKQLEPILKIMRKDIMKMKNVDIKKYKIENLR